MLSPYLPPDLMDFLGLCESGQLYETLIEGIGWAGDKDRFKDEELFPVLYGPVKDLALSRYLQSRFPSVHAFIVWHKRRYGYKQLPREMQRAESRLMIEGVCGQLRNDYPTCPVVTVHDGILTTQPWLEKVQEIILSEFAKLGLTPTLRLK